MIACGLARLYHTSDLTIVRKLWGCMGTAVRGDCGGLGASFPASKMNTKTGVWALRSTEREIVRQIIDMASHCGLWVVSYLSALSQNCLEWLGMVRYG